MAFVDGTSTKNNEFLNRLEVDVEEGDFIDHWDSGELLFLASSVLRSDRNWASVARSIKPYGEQTRPSDWYTPKNCALQYQKLLNDIEEDAKQKTLPRIERETSEVMLVKSLTEKRLNELEWMNQQTKAAANITKTYLEMVESGDFDENLDDILKQIEEEEKNEEEKYNEYLMKRESLNAAKRLNKSRVIKSKAKAKIVEPKKRSGFSETTEESLQIKEEDEILKNIKKEIPSDDDSATSIKPCIVKTEMDTPITLNALLDSKVTLPSSVAPSSPFLTSLLRNITSSANSQSVASLSSLKEVKSEGPSQQLSQSSCAENSKKIDVFLTPAKIPSTGISPLLASLLKSATVPLSTHGNCMAATLSKESVPMDESDNSKGESELSIKSREASPRSSVPQSPYPTPASSPLLNSLLKNSPSSSTSFQLPTGKEISPKEVSSPQPFFNPTSALATAAAQQLAVATSTNPLSHQFFQPHEMSESSKNSLQSSPVTSASLSAPTLSKLLEMPPSTPGRLPPLPVLDPPTTPIISTPPVVMEHNPLASKTATVQMVQVAKKSLPESPVKESTVNKETVEPNFSTDTSVLQKSLHSYSLADKRAVTSISSKESSIFPSNEKASEKSISNPEDTSQETDALFEAMFESINQPFEDKSENESSKEDQVNTTQSVEDQLDLPDVSQKQTSSENIEKDTSKEELTEAKNQPSVLQESTKNKTSSTAINISQEVPTSSETPVSESIPMKIGDATSEEDSKSSKSSDSKSPISKKPRFFEKSSPDKVDLSENETPAIVRRSGRRGKKGLGKTIKNAPPKQIEPKDQYEFTESTEENSVGYQASNTLCYMPRIKEDSRSEDSKDKLTFAQESEASNTSTASTEKKVTTPVRIKPEVTNAQTSQVRKALFLADDEKLNEEPISDEASDNVLSEDKLKKWEETCHKSRISMIMVENNRRTPKITESLKKKVWPAKRNFAGKTIPGGKERKVMSSDAEDVSTGSRDSEEVNNQDKNALEEKVPVPAASTDMEIETSDSHPSSSNAAESDKQIDDIDGSESFQDSITTEFSPPSANENKDNKETPQFGKQDWFHIVSPKSSEAVSQSSEESEEYESDNWDNQSVSTNKSISHSTGTQSRPKRKERETPQQKKWKRAIGIVLRQISCHKNASVFLQKVTNDVAPGYLSIVHRPMDLSLIKKNIDNGVITTTEEFHRDIMLMFQNAIMYNNSDHDVHQMAVEMQRDVVELIMTFLSTQSEKDDVTEPVSSLRGARKSQKGLGKHPVSSTSKKPEEAD
ncbi:bromodomain-containing protein 8-like isoform X3 [Argiope bruennichi]|uniref:bromodomain-containing protein 8-like isoform X3 n=1 Tax=Argiope bruennichi TaxID=94029 RepID=UPI0024943272|nr:bromodomain-containing protein 8-like isoform X3 [Argiope bruennichi]